MNSIIPWERIVETIDSKINTGKPELWWRPKIATEKKLRMYFLSLWFNLSDISTEEGIYDRMSFQWFMNIDVTADQIPDSTTLCDFRNFLTENKLWEDILCVMNKALKSANLILAEWRLIDATIIKAPSSTKNANHARDPEMSSTEKSWNWHFGAKAHIITDTQWIIEDVVVSTASVHDSNMYEELVNENTKYTVADSWYTGERLKNIAQEKWIVHTAIKKRKRWQKSLSTGEKLWNTLIAMPRKVVEFPFGVIKHLWWHRKLRYRWLAKMQHQRYVLSALCNMYRMRKKYIARQLS